MLRAARLLPQRFAADLPQLGRISVLQRRAVLGDLVGRRALGHRGRRDRHRDQRELGA